jgi:glycosyltransferase involved in cell wall biosynthesis
MAAADLLVCPSRHEPLGNVIIEAWAHRLTVIAADAEGPRELIRPGIDGVLVPREDADALADMIVTMLLHPPARATLADAGYESYAQQFSEATVVSSYRDFIARVAA